MDTFVRERTLSQILDSAFDLLRSNFYVLVAIGFICSGLFDSVSEIAFSFVDDDEFLTLTAWLMVAWLPYTVLGLVAAVAISHALDDQFRGHQPRVRSVLFRSLGQLGPISAAGFIFWILSLVGFILLVIPAIIISLIFFVIGPVIAMESAPGVSALARSRRLMQDHKMRALAIFLFWFIPFFLLEPVFQVVFSDNSLPELLVRAVTLSIATAYANTATFLLYIDIRSRKEAYDLQYLAEGVSART